MKSVYVDIRSARLPNGDLRLRTIGYAFQSGIAVEARNERVWTAESVLDLGVDAIVMATRNEIVTLLNGRLAEAASE